MTMIRITIACPEALRNDANQLARCLGLSAADEATYGAPAWQDAGGNRYAVASGLLGADWLARAQAPLAAPAWGADLSAATRARALLRLADPDDPGTCAADPGHLVAIVHDDPHTALALMGVARGGEVGT